MTIGRHSCLAVLFLDIDGVLHPERPTMDSVDLFCRIHLLEALLLDCPGLRVVVSSTWRKARTLSQLRELFPSSIRDRVVGRTPIQLADHLIPERLRSYPREAQCVAWMRRRSHYVGMPYGTEAWLALDDHIWLFSPFCRQLIPVDASVGLTGEVKERAKQRYVELTAADAGDRAGPVAALASAGHPS